jgi:PAS domain S-box-containing protein
VWLTAGALSLVVVLGHVAGALLAHEVNNVTSQGVSLFPAAGLTVAVLLLVPRRSWWIALLSTFASEYLTNELLADEVFGTAFGSALSNVVEPLLGAEVVLWWLGHAPRLERPRELWAFLVGAVTVGPLLGTLVGVTSTRFTPGHAGFFHVAGRWFVGDGLGVLIVGSLILAWCLPDPAERRTRRHAVEAAVLAAVLALVTWLAFWGSVPALAYVTLPVLAVIALRFGVRGATTGGAVIAALADWATLSDHGLFYELSREHADSALWQLQLFLGIVLLTGILLASQVAQLDVASRALRAAEVTRGFEKLLESSPDPVVILGLEGRIEFVNRQFELLVGRSKDDLLGTQAADLLPERVRETAVEAFRQAGRSAEGSRTLLDVMHLGGTGRSFEAATSTMQWRSGPVLVATLREVTARLDAEAATREALAAAERSTRAKSEFLAMMSHEIRTPMNGVVGMVDILGRMSLENEQREIVATISESAEALLSVINDILDFSKIEAGKLDLEAAPFDLRDVVDGVTELLAAPAAAKGVELSCVVAQTVPQLVVGDVVRLRQVVFNLLGNAVKVTAEGAVRLTVEPLGDGREGISLRVRDTGIGMTPEQRERLFEPFVQAESSTTREYGGSGLGLAIVARLVELMDGSLEVTSTPGEGSSFTLELALPAAETAPTVQPLPGLSFLAVVSGRPSTRATASVEALRRAGAEVTVASGSALAEFSLGNRGGVDVVYVSREARDAFPDGVLDSVVRQTEGQPQPVAVSDRTAEGAGWLPHTTPVGTSALTARSLVRAVALASGRTPVRRPVLATRADARPVRADGPVVLVAEDHPTNRIVIRRQLALLGLACDVAEDGLEAWELLNRGDYALLLVDCHMPRLDGYALTERIRAGERGSERHLPIVALTASALPSEADRCLAAGMDLVLTKPVALETLDRALEPWLTERHELTEVPVMDLAVLRHLVGDDAEAVEAVTQSFVSSASASVALLDRAEAAGDAAGVRSVAHRLLGGARTLGAARLTQLCEQIESDLEGAEPGAVAQLRAEVGLLVGALATASTVTGGGQ